MFTGSAFASAPLSTTAEIFTIPFLVRSSATCTRIMSLSSSQSGPKTMPRLSRHPCRLEHCWRFRDLWVTTVHPPLLHASRSPRGELIRQDSLPRYSSWSVSSSTSVQQPSSLVSSPSGASCSRSLTHPSLGAQPRGVPNPSAHVACEAFSLAFHLGFFNGPSCSLRLRATGGGCPPHSVSAMCPATDLPWKILGSADPFYLFLCSHPSRQS